MDILITGASSYLGARLYFDLREGYSVTGTYAHNRLADAFVRLDTTDAGSVRDVITARKPSVIIHAAANANARWCEANPREAMLLNAQSTGFITDAADMTGALVILISSFAALAPGNVYGRSKAESERLVRSARGGYLILRPSLILGYSPNTVNDRPFNRLLRNLDDGVPAVYDSSWKFSPTYIGHVSAVIRDLIGKRIRDITVPVAVPHLTTRFETARDILSPFGIPVTPADNHDATPVLAYDPSVNAARHLPEMTYGEMITRIIAEIRNRKRYVL